MQYAKTGVLPLAAGFACPIAASAATISAFTVFSDEAVSTPSALVNLPDEHTTFMPGRQRRALMNAKQRVLARCGASDSLSYLVANRSAAIEFRCGAPR